MYAQRPYRAHISFTSRCDASAIVRRDPFPQAPRPFLFRPTRPPHASQDAAAVRLSRNAARPGVCASCVNRAAPGRVHCRTCGVARRKLTSARRRKQTRLAAGRCPRCTGPLTVGRALCAGCLSDRQVARRERKARWAAGSKCLKCGHVREDPARLHCGHCRAQGYAYKAQYVADGFCPCGRFRAPGRQACETCLTLRRDAQRRRRAAVKRKESL